MNFLFHPVSLLVGAAALVAYAATRAISPETPASSKRTAPAPRTTLADTYECDYPCELTAGAL